jgi:hypothetical protein
MVAYTTTLQLTVIQLVKKFPAFHGNQSLTVVRKTPPSDFMLSQMKPVNRLTFYFFKIHFNIILPSTLRCPKWSRPSGFSKWNYQSISNFSIAFYMPSHSQICYIFSSLSLSNRQVAYFETSKINTVCINETYILKSSRPNMFLYNECFSNLIIVTL